MHFLRRHSYGIPLALVLLAFPMQAYAQSLDIDFSTIWNGFNRGLQEAAYFIVINGLGLLVWFGALLLDFAVNNFVIGFGDTFVNSGIGLAVNQTWIIIRDFVNMFFIFGFVYIGFKMILNSADSNTRRWLVNILLAALLVNFSLFVTKFAIDFSNQLASQIAVNGLGSTGAWNSETGLYEVNLTSEFMSRMGISSIMGISFGTVAGGGWGYVIGTAILFLTAAFVFAAGGILLIIRFAVLNLFMMLSPLMFLSWVLPPVKDTMQRFWSQFFGRALYAPIYLLFIYFSLQIIAGLQISVGGNGSDFANPNWAGAFQSVDKISGTGNAVGTLGTLPFFILICIFLAFSVSMADKLGADGGSMAVKLGKSFQNKVRRTAASGTKFAVSQTGGRIARAGADRLGGRLNSQLQSIQQGTGLAARIARMNAVQGVVGGAATSMQNAQFGLSRTRAQDRAMRNTTAANADQRNRIDAARTVPPISAISTDQEITARQEARGQLQNEVRSLSNEQILERARMNRDEVMSPEFASLLSDAQVTALRDSGILTNEQSDTLETNRDTYTFEEITATLENANSSTENLTAAMESLNRVVSTMSNDRLANMVNTNPDLLRNPNIASRLSSAQVDAMRQSGNLTAAQMTQVTDARNDGFVRIARDGSLGNPLSPGGSDTGFQDRQRRGMFRNAQDAGRLPIDVLAATASAPYLTPRILEEFLSNNPSPGHITQVRSNITNYLASGRAPANATDVWSNWTRRTVAGRQFNL